MSTNRVEDGRRAERQVREDQREKRRQGAKREENRSFSQMMKKREMPSGERRGDERGRMLREGRVQKGERRERAARTERRHAERMQSVHSGESGGRAAKSDRRVGGRPERGGDGGLHREDSAEGAEGRDRGADVEESWRGSADAVQEVRNRTGRCDEAQAMEASRGKNVAMEEVARQIVDAVRVGEDVQARRVVFLDVTVPGRGGVRIRLRRDGGGMEVRMRADNDALARSLQEGVGELREKGAEKNIQFTSIRVVR